MSTTRIEVAKPSVKGGGGNVFEIAVVDNPSQTEDKAAMEIADILWSYVRGTLASKVIAEFLERTSYPRDMTIRELVDAFRGRDKY